MKKIVTKNKSIKSSNKAVFFIAGFLLYTGQAVAVQKTATASVMTPAMMDKQALAFPKTQARPGSSPLTRTINSGMLPQYPTAYSVGSGGFPYQFDDTSVTTLANDVATWATFIEALVIQNSNTIIGLNDCCKNNSNAITKLDFDVANITLDLAQAEIDIITNAQGIQANSNALLYCCRNNSNAIIGALECCRHNSDAIIWLDRQLQTIDHGPLDIDVNISVTNMTYDIHLSEDHFMFINNTTVIDGHGHSIDFANNCPDNPMMFIVDDSIVVLKDVVLKNYSDGAIVIGANSDLIFGDCTRVELSDMQEQFREWTFQGDTELRGHDNRLMLAGFGIKVLPNSQLRTHNIDITGVKGNNIRCAGETSSVVYKDTRLCLEQDYSFTSGSMQFSQEVKVTGTNAFTYATDQTSTILGCSTLLFDTGSGFVYEPSIDNRDLLACADETSHLFLNGCSLSSSTTGMRLTRGTLVVDHKNILFNGGATSLSEAIAFGNGFVDDDLKIEILPGGSIDVKSGLLDYQNVN